MRLRSPLFIALAALAATLMLAGCSDEGGSDPQATSTTDTQTTADSDTTTDTLADTIEDTTPDTAADTADTIEDTAMDTVSDTTLPERCDPTATPFGGTVDIPNVGAVSLLCSPTQLDNLRTDPIGNFVLDADIDLTGLPWLPVPEFQGTLAGQDHEIIGLSLDCNELKNDGTPLGNCGFIRVLSNGGLLSDLRFSQVSTGIIGSGGTVAAFVKGAKTDDLGKATDTPAAVVQNVHVAGHVTVVGSSSGALFRAILDGGQVHNVSFTGTLAWINTGVKANIGGITWRLQGTGRASEIAFRGTISAPGGAFVAGMVAEMTGTGTLSDCVFDGTLTGQGDFGGLIGIHNGGEVTNCRVVGRFEAADSTFVGGFVNRFQLGSIAQSYVAANIGPGKAAVANPSADINASDILYDDTLADDDLGVGLTTAEMQDPANAAWDDFTSPPWTFVPGSYPTLAFEADIPDLALPPTFVCGTGTCLAGAEACHETLTACAPPYFSCAPGTSSGSVAACVASDDPCDCLRPDNGQDWACDASNADGHIRTSLVTTCEAAQAQ